MRFAIIFDKVLCMYVCCTITIHKCDLFCFDFI